MICVIKNIIGFSVNQDVWHNKERLTKHAAYAGSRPISSSFLASGFFCSRTESTSAMIITSESPSDSHPLREDDCHLCYQPDLGGLGDLRGL